MGALEMYIYPHHRWELLGCYHVFTMVMVIYHYVEKIWIILITPNFFNLYYHKKIPGETVNIHIQSLITIILEKNWVVTTKKG